MCCHPTNEYSNRWARAWRQAVIEELDFADAPPHPPGSYPPFDADAGAKPLRPDQVLPILLKLPSCSACPKGMTASPWNGWGGYPIVTAFMVPLDGVPADEMQQVCAMPSH